MGQIKIEHSETQRKKMKTFLGIRLKTLTVQPRHECEHINLLTISKINNNINVTDYNCI